MFLTISIALECICIVGSSFDGQLCEYNVEIGSSYHCPLVTMTRTELICRIENGSLLDTRRNHVVRVTRLGQGYLGSSDELLFTFLTSIFSISPSSGTFLF